MLPNFYSIYILKGNQEGITRECLEYLYQLKHYNNYTSSTKGQNVLLFVVSVLKDLASTDAKRLSF